MGGFWLHPVSFLITGLILSAGTQYEYYKLIRSSGIKPRVVPGMIAGISAYLLSSLAASGMIPLKSILWILPVIILIMISELYRPQERPFDSLAHTFFPLIYTVIPFSMFPFSAFSHTGLSSLLSHGELVFSPGIVIGFFLLIWSNDTGAYLAGVSFGRHKLMKSISPKKTWEGFIGGILLAIIIAWLLSGWLGVISRAGWVVIALIISVAGTYGDLVESMLKRSAGVKDSGTILPGHGGFLDRFDSTIITFPLVYLFIALFG
jgi:phosphatidate cytidylyltransferase